MALGASEAAKRLGVSPIRVRELIREGRLEAQKIGRQWVIEDSALAKLTKNSAPGRPMTSKNALTLALMLEGKNIPKLSSVEEHRLQKQVRNLLVHGDPKKQLQLWLSARATPLAFEVSDADLLDFREDDRIFLSGVSDPRSGLLPGNEVEAYTSRDSVNRLAKEWFLVPASKGRKGNVTLRIVDDYFDEVPAIYSAMDLAEHPGPREQAASDSIIRDVLNGN